MSRNPFVNQVVCFGLESAADEIDDESRNPFVNQVVCFRKKAESLLSNILMSQSLRESGRLFPKHFISICFSCYTGRNPFVNQVVCFVNYKENKMVINIQQSQSLRESGRLFQITVRYGNNTDKAVCRNPFVNQVVCF